MKGLSRIFSSMRTNDKKLHYDNAISNIQLIVDCAKSPLEKIRSYNYAMFVVRADYAAYTKSLMFRKKFAESMSAHFPTSYYLADGTEETFSKEDVSRNIPLCQADNIAVIPWKCSRLAAILPVIYQKGFIADDNHKANYYAEIDFTVVYSGNHSISAGIFFGSGSINADVYLLSRLYEHVDTDGVYWKNRHNGKVLTKVFSVHMAILYEISRRKNAFLCSLDLATAEFCRSNGGCFVKSRKSYTVICGDSYAGESSFIGTIRKGDAVFIDKGADSNEFNALLQKRESIIEENMCLDSVWTRICSAKEYGYYIRLILIGNSTEESFQCSDIGCAKTGCEGFNNNVFLSAVKNCPELFCSLLQMCDTADFFDNDGFTNVAHWDGQTFSLSGTKYPEWFRDIHILWLNSLSSNL